MLVAYEDCSFPTMATTFATRNGEEGEEEAATPRTSYADFSGPIEVKIIQLLPDFDGCFDTFEEDGPSRSDIVSYTSAEMDGMQKDIASDNVPYSYLDDFFQDPVMLPALGISPSMVMRIRSDSMDKTKFMKPRVQQQQQDDVESEESDAEGCVPVLLGRSSPRYVDWLIDWLYGFRELALDHSIDWLIDLLLLAGFSWRKQLDPFICVCFLDLFAGNVFCTELAFGFSSIIMNLIHSGEAA